MYRAPPNADLRARSSRSICESDELSLVLVLLLLWVASVVRAVGPVLRGESFDGEASVALLAVVIVPLLVGDTLVAWRRRVRTGDPSRGSARGNAAPRGPID